MLGKKEFGKLRLSYIKDNFFHESKYKTHLALLFTMALICNFLIYKKQSSYSEFSDSFADLIISKSLLFCFITPVAFVFIAQQLVLRHFYFKDMLKRFEQTLCLTRNFDFEKKILRNTFKASSILMLIYFLNVAIFDLNYLNMTVMAQTVPHMSVKEGERLWIDERYGLSSSLFQIEKSILVSYEYKKFDFVGLVVGMPKDLVSITIDGKGRKLASVQPVVVPDNFYAIKGEITLLVPIKDIKGKALKSLNLFSKIN